jgi:transcriptional regulator GlxA family with amidase domain
MRNIAILIFNDVEVLDFCGPFEVFSVANELQQYKIFNVYTVAEAEAPIIARNGLSINPDYTIHNAPAPDILLVPGGQGTRKEMHNRVLLGWISLCAEHAEFLLSVCTGALLYAILGFLDGLSSTTHRGALQLLKETAPLTRVDASKRFIDNGKIIVSAGISAGIDMSLYVIARLLGKDTAFQTAGHMEYSWNE